MILLYLLLFVLSAAFLWLKYVFSHWQRKGFPYIKPSLPFGNLAGACLRKRSIGMNLYDLYHQTNERIIGVYLFFRPALLVRDAELVKAILKTDFDHFHDRGVFHADPNHDPIASNMFVMKGQMWKSVRTNLTPAFTSGKLKAMMPTIIQISENLQRKLDPMAEKGEIVEMKDMMTRFAVDIVGTVSFGISVNSIDDANNMFRTIESTVNNGEFINSIRTVGSFLCPDLLKYLNMSPLPAAFKDFMYNMVKETIEYREKNNVVQKDFIQCLIQIRNSGKVNIDDSLWDSKTAADGSKAMTIEQCAGQVALLYLAGFDTTSSAVANTLYELAQNPDLMERLQRDIDDTLTKHNGIISYEAVQEITLLELCVQESIRKYPTLPLLNRICTEDYKIPNSDLIVPKGTPIVISLLGLLRDANYFPEPEKFMPERFLPENNNKFNASAYVPFGDGPRTCIAFRLGKIVAKVGLVQILRKYNFEALDNKPLEFEPHSVTLVIAGGVNLRVTKRTNST